MVKTAKEGFFYKIYEGCTLIFWEIELFLLF